ncbi:hypothetical protein C5167_047568 [Papaver somniferum]|uniref:Uncharacterized protein n=1 Tax=Papaver somniferum TaxID=3469 RepID=A0A4Y7LHR3_PAPSO|nr:hypothetical protein C5167_047568 [Papaver somniferum]
MLASETVTSGAATIVFPLATAAFTSTSMIAIADLGMESDWRQAGFQYRIGSLGELGNRAEGGQGECHSISFKHSNFTNVMNPLLIDQHYFAESAKERVYCQ